jgi:uncharacterized protein YbaR (Trm112 family)
LFAPDAHDESFSTSDDRRGQATSAVTGRNGCSADTGGTVTIDSSLLEILACPSDDHAPLRLEAGTNELACTACDRVYPIRDGIPVLLLDEARRTGTTAGENA